MPKITVQVSDKSLEFFHQLMKELKFKVVENGTPNVQADAKPAKGKAGKGDFPLPDLELDASGMLMAEAEGKKDRKHKDKKDKKKKKKEKEAV